MPAINDMIDVRTGRMSASGSRLPALIFLLFVSVALLSGLLAGYAMAKRKSRSWLQHDSVRDSDSDHDLRRAGS